jgi:hypothetical protein
MLPKTTRFSKSNLPPNRTFRDLGVTNWQDAEVANYCETRSKIWG